MAGVLGSAAAAVSAARPAQAITASAICVTMRQTGFAFGIALIGALLQSDDPHAYATAFAVIAVCTVGLAIVVFPCSAAPKDEQKTAFGKSNLSASISVQATSLQVGAPGTIRTICWS
ncbi:hypothetical protein [Xanthobacter autotrophicus]|uniref:hypothetical protein n=1 Tax=Xanthobacter autotrophicus TaxID=280 RepID=UPI0037277BB7